MTQEQYNRAVWINDRLKELEEVKKEIGTLSKHLLTYCKKDEYKPCHKWIMQNISNILDRHDKMIREEIDAEIERLKNEISKL